MEPFNGVGPLARHLETINAELDKLARCNAVQGRRLEELERHVVRAERRLANAVRARAPHSRGD